MSVQEPSRERGPGEVTESGPRRKFDRTSRIVAIAIVAAIIIPVLWMVIASAMRGPDAFDENQPSGSRNRPSLRTTLPPLRNTTTLSP